jgi:hypothetical protein
MSGACNELALDRGDNEPDAFAQVENLLDVDFSVLVSAEPVFEQAANGLPALERRKFLCLPNGMAASSFVSSRVRLPVAVKMIRRRAVRKSNTASISAKYLRVVSRSLSRSRGRPRTYRMGSPGNERREKPLGDDPDLPSPSSSSGSAGSSATATG